MEIEPLTRRSFTRVDFAAWICDIEGGFLKGGATFIINLQNSDKAFIHARDDESKEVYKFSGPISNFDEGLEFINGYINERNGEQK